MAHNILLFITNFSMPINGSITTLTQLQANMLLNIFFHSYSNAILSHVALFTNLMALCLLENSQVKKHTLSALEALIQKLVQIGHLVRLIQVRIFPIF